MSSSASAGRSRVSATPRQAADGSSLFMPGTNAKINGKNKICLFFGDAYINAKQMETLLYGAASQHQYTQFAAICARKLSRTTFLVQWLLSDKRWNKLKDSIKCKLFFVDSKIIFKFLTQWQMLWGKIWFCNYSFIEFLQFHLIRLCRCLYWCDANEFCPFSSYLEWKFPRSTAFMRHDWWITFEFSFE